MSIKPILNKQLNLIKESFLFALSSVSVNKLRTFLSLFGITIGIFAIISVYTVIDALESNVKKSIATLGENTLYIDRWEWVGGMNYPWWEYIKRPLPKLEEAKKIEEMSQTAEAVAYSASLTFTVKRGSKSTDKARITGVTFPYNKVRAFDIQDGRYFTELETRNGNGTAIIGTNIVKELFDGASPIGETIKIGPLKATVVGVFKREGKMPMNDTSIDDEIIVPVSFAQKLVNFKTYEGGLYIIVKGKSNIALTELKDEIRMLLRKIRKIPPAKKDDFAINEMATITQSTEGIFSTINLAGMVIGGLSIIVGGFGIANIMFVSVRERTNIIGIQKSLGAKKAFILLQFVYESVLLAVIGGAIGLLIVFSGTFVFNHAFPDFPIKLTLFNIVRGLLISGVIGFLSGLLPAIRAANLDPVVAINTK
jgi:ABC-type antimicrobial peptide transport system, permease component